MDWKILISTFGAVFIAELADKTQIVGLTMAAKTKSFAAVWVGSIGAYIVITTVSILIGLWLGKSLSNELLRYVAGSLFVVLGILMFTKII